MKRYLFIFTCLFFALFNQAISQVDFLLVEDGAGESGQFNNLPIKIILVNNHPLAGLQFILEYDSSALVIDTIVPSSRLSDMNFYSHEFERGRLILLAASVSGNLIEIGSGKILQIEFNVKSGISPQASEINLKEIVISDSTGESISVAGANGYFVIRGSNILRIGNGFENESPDTISVNLFNESPIGALQMELDFNPAVFSLDTILPESRIQLMDLDYNLLSPGKASVVIYSLNQDSIQSGMGVVFKIALMVNQGVVHNSLMVSQIILPNNVVFSSPAGSTLSKEDYPGIFLLKYTPPVKINNKNFPIDLPKTFRLLQNYPNPFNPVTKIRFVVPKPSHILVEVYNVLGQRVSTLVNEEKPPGYYVVDFNASSLASGFYIYRLEANGFNAVRKMIVTK